MNSIIDPPDRYNNSIYPAWSIQGANLKKEKGEICACSVQQ